LPLLILLLLQPLIFFVFVLRLLALQGFLVFVILDFPCARLLQILFLLFGVLSVGVRKSETVALRDPVMPVTDGFSG
jgi:hypothetical protein